MRWLMLWVLLGFGLLGSGLAGAWYVLNQPYGGTAHVQVLVERGQTLRPLLARLAQQKVLRYPKLAYAYARWRGQTGLRSGLYAVRAAQTPRQILWMFFTGQVILEPLTIAEGLNRWQVRSLLVHAKLMTAAQFDQLCDDRPFLAQQRIPGPSCEGYLFPETYKISHGVAPAAIFAAMFANYHQAMAPLRRTASAAAVPSYGPHGLSENQFVTLASIVEKETGASAERARIACVFYNRLQAQPPWRLETDPTVIYAATLADPHFNGNLTRAHLHYLDSPYNTYRVFGLPPGPIANPGHAALLATAQPSACKDFFFVSTNHGQHIFCPTLACHNRAVQKWQVNYFRKAAAPITKPAP